MGCCLELFVDLTSRLLLLVLVVALLKLVCLFVLLGQ